MDEMRINFSSKFMSGIISKLISRAVYKKYGCHADIRLSNIDINFINGDTKLSANIEANLSNAEFVKIVKSFGLD